MDLFAHIKSGKFGKNPKLKRESKHELKELGGEKLAEAHEKRVKMAKKMSLGRKSEHYIDTFLKRAVHIPSEY